MNSPTDSVFGYPLSYTIQHFEKFKAMPPNQQQAMIMNASKFEQHYDSHFMSPEELADKLGGSAATWRQFLTLKPVRDYVERKVREDTDILNRQALFKQAQKAIKSGDSSAAKILGQLAEANATQTNQQQVILHYVKRPEREPASVPSTSSPYLKKDGG